MSSLNSHDRHASGLNTEQMAYVARLSRERLSSVQIAAKTGLHPDRVTLALASEGWGGLVSSRPAAE